MYGIAMKPDMADGHPKWGKAIVAGLIGGVVGTAVKTVCEIISPPRPPGQESPLGVGIRLISTHFTGHDLEPTQKKIAEMVMHWGFGTMTGIAFAVLAERWVVVTIGYGVAFGILFWIALHEIFLPAIGWSASPLGMTAWEQGNEFVSHIFYGVGVELTRRSVRPRL